MLSKKVCIVSLFLALNTISSPAFAGWVADTDTQSTVERMKSEDLLHTRSNGYFAITLNEITSTPQMSGLTAAPAPKAKYAVIIDESTVKAIAGSAFLCIDLEKELTNSAARC